MASQRLRLIEWLKIYPVEYLKKGQFIYYVRKIFRKTKILYSWYAHLRARIMG